jgi:hypothetical protein
VPIFLSDFAANVGDKIPLNKRQNLLVLSTRRPNKRRIYRYDCPREIKYYCLKNSNTVNLVQKKKLLLSSLGLTCRQVKSTSFYLDSFFPRQEQGPQGEKK